MSKNIPNHSFKEGDVLVSQWGATMRLVSFYKIIRLKGKQFVELRELKSEETGDGGFLTGTSRPNLDEFVHLQAHERLDDGSPRKPIIKQVKRYPDTGRDYVPVKSFEHAVAYDPSETYSFNHCD